MNVNFPAPVTDYLALVERETLLAVEPVDPPPAQPASKLAQWRDPDEGTLWHLHFDQPAISRVTIDLNRLEVEKRVGRFAEFGILERERLWLERLAATGAVPQLRAAVPQGLILGYVGEPVRNYNLPPDWRDQAERLLAALASVNCAHNDIKCDNLAVLDGRLYLLDFGWATEIGAPIPADWPDGIGRQHRLGIHRFDDRHALLAALASAERNEVDRSIVMPPRQ